MRIVLVGPYAPYRGGIAHFAAGVRRGLAARGHHVEPVTFSRQYPRLLFPGKTQVEEDRGEVPAIRLIDSINPYSWYHSARVIEGRRPDAVVYSYWMPFFAPAYGTMARLLPEAVRQVAVIHNALPHERRPGDKLFGRFFLKACDGLLALSGEVERDSALLAPGVPIRRAPHPVYDIFGDPPSRAQAREELGLPSTAPVALFFGMVRGYKGLPTLLRALPEVIGRLPDFRLMVAGEFYEGKEEALDLISTGELEDRVILRDEYIPSRDVARYFAAADVVVQPYHTATQSGVAQIAYHFGRPLIVTDVGGLPEVVPHERAGLVVPPDDPDALAGAIVRFFSEDLGADLSQGVAEERERYGWKPVIDALEQLVGQPTAT